MLHSFPLMCVSCFIHFTSHWFSFMFLSFSIHFLSFSVACITHTGLRKVICSNRSSGYLPKRSRPPPVSLSFCYHFGGLCSCHLQGSRTCTGIRYMNGMSSLSSLFLSFFWAGNALVVLRGKASQAKMKGLLSQIALRRYSHTVFRVSS